jgi:hypothetical protein
VRIHARKVRSFARWSLALPIRLRGMDVVKGVVSRPAVHSSAPAAEDTFGPGGQH